MAGLMYEFFHEKKKLGDVLVLVPMLVPKDYATPAIDFGLEEYTGHGSPYYEDVGDCARHMDWQEPFDYVFSIER